MIGSTIAHYKVTAKLGEGGMGEVYRAEDDRLNRDVAIKILPESVEQDPSRLARFRREAQVLASLTHGNVAQVYGLEEQDGKHAIVLELVEGEDLSATIARGALSIDEARAIALQIAEGLEAAHDKGIVHRDLKPANIKLAPDGTVKILDFGLAKAVAGEEPEQDLATSPTMTAAATQAGLILGTAAYMAPEQAKGKPVDRRADVWAFGCVLYEMLTGRAPFEGDGVSELLAHVITQEPDFDALPDDLPTQLRDTIRRCLRKDPRMRMPDIAAARIALFESTQAPDEPKVSPTQGERSTGGWGARIALAICGLLVGLAVGWAVLGGDDPAPAATHFDLVLDPPHVPGPVALSSDAGLLVYSGRVDGRRQLFVRRLDGHASQLLPGTEGGKFPFFSPDAQHVGFFAEGQLKRVSLAGGRPEPLVPAPGDITGALWAPDDTILFSTPVLGIPHRVDARGGESAPIKVNGREQGFEFHVHELLPDGETLLLTREDVAQSERDVVVLNLVSGDWASIVRGSGARFVAPDRLLFVQQGQAMTVEFDPSGLEIVGDPRPPELFDPGVSDEAEIPAFFAAVTDSGALVYPSGAHSEIGDLMRVSPSGVAEPTGLTGRLPRSDKGGRRVLVSSGGADANASVLDLVDQTETPVTFSNSVAYPLWSHDDRQVVFSDRRSGVFEVFAVAADGSGGSTRQFENPVPTSIATSFSSDGTMMGYGVHPQTSRDIWLRRPDGETDIVLQTAANERAPAIAPKGRYFAYVSNEDGDDQVYLRDLDALERRWPVSTDGGTSPVWSRDGRELYFMRGNSILGVTVGVGGGVRIGAERQIFSHERLNRDEWGNCSFDVLPDGSFLVSVIRESQVVLRVVLGYRGE